ncbi:DUF1642 domain-containing protein [Enterococcus faecium]|uniref:DUF1642 domain-containing protein n=1 Tax=Enterococcus TaxID=1350 RepID=UPI0018991AEA|nr:DUF1642 domain-containing protein [Enterococcus faecium]MDB7366104.1 DUF1642 domain-containing protein [Enterococcus faecium]MDB7519751.1 DUF1642 domain-containing protein [Enterococcus faecium]MDB7522428.1 DUF1642 domain-containing protein [Enterococcus faecium]MDB7527842.1 DUF1642 domain-containing protein [Enterococcus faecium]MDB7530493.1 DUF1642 domain-containing protein [Enterococcus faecium]
MNKQQELIDKLARLVGSMEDFKGISAFHDGKYAGLEHALELIQQLNESQKPVIPQLVAGWLEKSTDPFTKAEKISYLIKSKDGDSYYFCDWFVRDGIVTQEQGEELLAWATRQSYETLLSLYNGYEVEKEPLYEVIIGDLYLIKKFNNRNDFCFDTSCSLCAWEKSAYQLTEVEIKEIDERYWPFAVPVEEVTK